MEKHSHRELLADTNSLPEGKLEQVKKPAGVIQTLNMLFFWMH